MDELDKILKNKNVYDPTALDYNEVLKIGICLGLMFRKKSFPIEKMAKLLSNNHFIKTVVLSFVDYRSLNGFYGEWIDYHSNNKERAKGNMLYGMMDGKWMFWYHNGVKELECEFDFGNPIGSTKIYHDNGVLKQELKL